VFSESLIEQVYRFKNRESLIRTVYGATWHTQALLWTLCCVLCNRETNLSFYDHVYMGLG